eukprot:1063887-Prymnesium_polylepis.1
MSPSRTLRTPRAHTKYAEPPGAVGTVGSLHSGVCGAWSRNGGGAPVDGLCCACLRALRPSSFAPTTEQKFILLYWCTSPVL